MRIFLVLSAAPRSDGEAVEVVAYEVAQHAVRFGHTLFVQIILRDPLGSEASVRATEGLQRLKIENAVAYPPLYVPRSTNGASTQRDVLIHRCIRIAKSFRESEMFPASRLGSRVAARVRESRADVILGVWSWEALAATYRIRDVPKFMYYGNPDHVPLEARLRHPELFGIPSSTFRDRVGLALDRLRNRRRRYLHIQMMNQCEVTANNSILDARFYAQHGHPRSIYLQNMWPTVCGEGDDAKGTGPGGDGVIRIVASVGNLGATGNTFGLYYFGKELMPRLDTRLAGRPLEIHILGKGAPTAAVNRHLDDPRIIRRGWVEDINQEIQSSQVFLVLTNVSHDFLVGNTRILLAWSLGACVVMHANSALAMPEVEDGYNALLGRSPEEIADLIGQVVEDDALRRKIGSGGHETFQRYYRSDVVVPKMMTLIQELVMR